MLFKDTFYSVNSQDLQEGTATFNITINKDHNIFEGHFPNNPITPGVVQMEIVKELLAVITGKEMKMISMGNCKFLAFMNPLETPIFDVTLNYSDVEGNTKVAGQMKTDETVYMKISALYQ